MPTPQSSSEENHVHADVYRVSSGSTDRSVKRNRLAQKRYRERQKTQMEDYRNRVDEMSQQLSQLSTEKSSLEGRVRLLEKMVDMQKDKAKEPHENPALREADDNEYSLAVARYANTVRQQREPLVSIQDVASWDMEGYRQMMGEYVSALASFLAAGAEDQEKTGGEIFAQLEAYVLKCRCAKWTLITKQNWRAMAKKLAARPSNPPPNILPDCLKAAKLSADQERDIVKSHGAYLERSERHAQERARILANLQGATRSDLPTMVGTGGGCANAFSLSALVQAGRASEDLKENLRREQNSRLDYYTEFSQVVTPLQEANVWVACYPHPFDPYEMSQLLYQRSVGGCTAPPAMPAAGVAAMPAPPLQPFSSVSGVPSSGGLAVPLPHSAIAASAQPPIVALPGLPGFADGSSSPSSSDLIMPPMDSSSTEGRAADLDFFDDQEAGMWLEEFFPNGVAGV